MTHPTPITPAEDPRDRRRRRTALACAAVSSGTASFALGALTHSWEYVYRSGIFWIGAISVASIAALWALITSSTKDAVGQLIELIVVRIKAIAEETRTTIGNIVREVLRDEVREQLTAPGTAIAGDLSRIKDRVYMRPDDDPANTPTVPIRYERPIQHTIGVAPVAGGVYNGRMEAVVNQALERFLDSEAFNERVKEYGRQKHFEGYAECAQDMTGGGVVPITRNGQRTTS